MSIFQGGPTDEQNIYEERDAAFNGGSRGFVNALRRIVCNITGAVQSFEWPDLVILNRKNSASLGEHVARYTQVNNLAAGGEIWGHCTELNNSDTSGTSTLVGHEIDCKGAIEVVEDIVLEEGSVTDILFRAGGPGKAKYGFDLKVDFGMVFRGAQPIWLFYNPDRNIGMVLIDKTVSLFLDGKMIVLGSV